MTTTSSQTTNDLLTLSNTLADAVERAGRSVVTVNGRHRIPSSGVHWRSGVIVTANHTIDREEGVTVTLPSGEKADTALVGRDPTTDLAVLRLQGAELATADVAADGEIKVGHIVVAVARPGELGLSASLGSISAVGGSWRTWAGGQIDQFVRPDLNFYPGFSGGPLIDAQGRALGINTSGLSRAMGLTIPASTVNRVAEQLLTKGRVARGYLGVGLQPVRLPQTQVQDAKLASDHALIVVSVESGGPAERGGLLVGDVITSLGGQAVSDTHDVQAALDPDRVGKSIDVQIIRAGKPTEIQLTVGERPARQ